VGRVYIDVKNKIKQDSKKIICCHMRAQVLGRALHAVDRIAGFTLALSSPRAGDLLDKASSIVCVYARHDMISLDRSYNTGSGTPGAFVKLSLLQRRNTTKAGCMSPFWLSN